MGYELAKKIRELVPYEPIQGSFPVRLDANESCIDLNADTPLGDPALEAGRLRLREKIAAAMGKVALNRYPDPLCAGVCEAFGALYEVPEEWVTAGNGSDELIALLMGCLLEGGETVLSLTPDFSMYAFYAVLYERRILCYDKDGAFGIALDRVIALAKREGVRAIVFSNPCNPTGCVLRAEEVRQLCTALPDCLIVADEAYMEFCRGPEGYSALPFVGEFDNLVVLKTCSKAIGLAALRLGFAVSNQRLTRALRAAKSPYNVNSLTQAAAQAVLEEKAFLGAAAEYLIRGREQLEAGVRALAGNYPALGEPTASSTNFVFFEVENTEAVWRAMLEKGIALRCMGNRLRVSTGTAAENRLFLQALEGVLQGR